MVEHGPTGPSETSQSLSMSSARAAVLGAVRERGRLCSVREIAHDFDLHPNTVREHLDALLEQGLVARETSSPTGRGRPALMYRATSGSAEAIRDYELLTDVLAEQIARTEDPQAMAREAGRTWARRSLEEKGGSAPLADLPVEIGRLGFEPTMPDADGTMVLRSCPILGAAKRHPEVVCTVHLGYVEALVEAAGHETQDIELAPMGDPQGCALRVGALSRLTTPS